MSWASAVIKPVVLILVIVQLLPLLIWVERKGSAYIQDRPGPNRATILGFRLGGFFHTLADVIKLLTKEDVRSAEIEPFYWRIAPAIPLFTGFVVAAVIPFAEPLSRPGGLFTFQVADLTIGLLWILSISSLAVYGVIFAGWSSGNKFATLGSLRASAQMVSYEITMGLSLVAVLLMSGTVRLEEIVEQQSSNPAYWLCLRQPLALMLFWVALFAETNRNPFDLPEGESELVAGYHLEYSGMRFALFYMAEYVHIIVGAALLITLFFGGWQIPFCPTWLLKQNLTALFSLLPALTAHFNLDIIAALVQAGCFLSKVLVICWCFIWVRWTLPRFRYDQLMRLGWKVMLPLALANIFGTGLVLL